MTSYDVWFLRYGVQQTEFFVNLDCFSNFEKMKKPPENIIILHMCTINDNHMIYGSRDKNSFFPYTTEAWFSLDPTIINSKSLEIFKSKLLAFIQPVQ